MAGIREPIVDETADLLEQLTIAVEKKVGEDNVEQRPLVVVDVQPGSKEQPEKKKQPAMIETPVPSAVIPTTASMALPPPPPAKAGTTTTTTVPPLLSLKVEDTSNKPQPLLAKSFGVIENGHGGRQPAHSGGSNGSSSSSSTSSSSDPPPVPLILMNKGIDLIHPLENSWTFWYLKNETGKDWQENLMKIATFSYVEEFWALFNHLRVATRLPPSCDYMLFKSTILPCWEDPQNSKGGRWVLYFSKNDQVFLDLDVCWLASMLALIGGQYANDTNYVNGVVLSARKSCDRIALWTSVNTSQALCERIGRRLRELINIPRTIKLLFELHNQQQTIGPATAATTTNSTYSSSSSSATKMTKKNSSTSNKVIYSV